MAQKHTLDAQDVQTLIELLDDQGLPGASVPGACWETANSMSVEVVSPVHGHALLKLYRNEGKYRREVTALVKLNESEYAPKLFGNSQLSQPVSVVHQRRGGVVDWGFFILRAWFAGVPGAPPEPGDQDAFLKCVFAFCDHCAMYELQVGDMKRDAFVWHEGKLTWIDYDGFSTTDDYAANIRNHNRAYVRSRLVRFGVLTG